MGFRFRKSLKIAPGLRINLSKSGVSYSLGRRGLTTNISSRGIRETVGIPGTGLSYSKNISENHERLHEGKKHGSDEKTSPLAWIVLWAVIALMFIGVVLGSMN